MRRSLMLLALIAAGEAVFFVPFVLPRIFRPTFLDVFGVTNFELGIAFSIYGIVAMVGYFCGGPLADRFRPRPLLAFSLWATALGGFVLLTIPTLATLQILYAYWGFTTIALFWAALIRATREWGDEAYQGAAFGMLDGGRGLFAAATGSVMVAVYASMIPEDVASATPAERAVAFRRVIQWMMLMTAAAGLLIWLILPAGEKRAHAPAATGFGLRRVALVMRMPTVWLQAFIILCAYTGYKAADDFSLYANEVVGLDEVASARAGTVSLWMRPLAAVAAGFLADRIGAGIMTVMSFALMLLGSLMLASGAIGGAMLWLFLITIVCASLGIFALRGLYFAIMQEGRVPLAFTGTAVGLVSFVGYTPDVFMGPLMGWLLDRSPGAVGHQDVFRVVAGFALVGLLATLTFNRVASRVSEPEAMNENP